MFSHQVSFGQAPQLTLPAVDTLNDPLAIHFEVSDWSGFEPIVNAFRRNGSAGSSYRRRLFEELTQESQQKHGDDKS
jgi:hypothetical protein